MVQLHRDWPDVDVDSDPYHWPDPVYDLAYALDSDNTDEFDMRKAISSIEYVSRYFIAYGGRIWQPERLGGADLDMVLIAKLHKDSYLASGSKMWLMIEAWNDQTGWAGSFHVVTHLAETEEEATEKLSYYGVKKLEENALEL